MDTICGIYMIKNIVNGKVYVGKSFDINGRWRHHRYELNKGAHVNNHLQSAWNKYGEDSFEFSIVEECSEDELNNKEIYWIKKMNAYHNGYNQTEGGEGTHLPEDIKQKISESAKERFTNIENHPMYGRHHSDESRDKMSISQRKRFDDETQREKNSQVHMGIRHSESSKKKMSESVSGENNPRSRAIYCIELDEFFWGATDAHNKYDININSICLCCKAKRKSAGKHPITGEPLHWLYADEWQVAV